MTTSEQSDARIEPAPRNGSLEFAVRDVTVGSAPEAVATVTGTTVTGTTVSGSIRIGAAP
jgi:hypothetical protein